LFPPLILSRNWSFSSCSDSLLAATSAMQTTQKRTISFILSRAGFSFLSLGSFSHHQQRFTYSFNFPSMLQICHKITTKQNMIYLIHLYPMNNIQLINPPLSNINKSYTSTTQSVKGPSCYREYSIIIQNPPQSVCIYPTFHLQTSYNLFA
jgi:hypothetical protein